MPPLNLPTEPRLFSILDARRKSTHFTVYLMSTDSILNCEYALRGTRGRRRKREGRPRAESTRRGGASAPAAPRQDERNSFPSRILAGRKRIFSTGMRRGFNGNCVRMSSRKYYTLHSILLWKLKSTKISTYLKFYLLPANVCTLLFFILYYHSDSTCARWLHSSVVCS